jgi:hypothetical protein
LQRLLLDRSISSRPGHRGDGDPADELDLVDVERRSVQVQVPAAAPTRAVVRVT